jgi:actin-like ATPase involved in cell morphogenesis
VTGIKTTVAKNPISCVAMGTGKYLSGISQFRDVAGGLTRDADTKPTTKK